MSINSSSSSSILLDCINVWKDFYINYALLSEILEKIKYIRLAKEEKLINQGKKRNSLLEPLISENDIIDDNTNYIDKEIEMEIQWVNKKCVRVKNKNQNCELSKISESDDEEEFENLLEENSGIYDYNQIFDKLEGVFENRDNEMFEKYENIVEKYINQLKIEIDKVNFFYQENYNNLLLKHINEIEFQINFAKKEKYKLYKNAFELSIKEAFKETYFLNKFIDQNIRLIYHALNLLKDYNYKYNLNVKKDYNEEIKIYLNEKTDLINSKDDLLKKKIFLYKLYKNEVEKYSKNNCNIKEILKHNKRGGADDIKNKFELLMAKKDLNDYANRLRIGSVKKTGVIINTCLNFVMLIILGIIMYIYNLDIDYDQELKSLIPMYRGFLNICLYFWLLGLNVYICDKSRIDYAEIFGIANLKISHFSLFKIANTFTALLFFSLFLYVGYRICPNFLLGLFNFIPIDILPLILWLSLMIYFSNPFEIFGPSYGGDLLELVKESALSFMMTVTFTHKFVISQIDTLISTMYDIEYTVCYYAYYKGDINTKDYYCNDTRGIYLLITFIPILLDILSDIKEIIDSDFTLFPFVYQLFSYILTISGTLLSFLYDNYGENNNILFIIWFYITIFSSIFFSFWDLKMDLEFFEIGPNFPLRRKLYYHKIYYYLILIFDLFVRFFWLLTLSPEILSTLFRPQTLTLVINLLELLRRFLWNILKLEKKVIETMGEYKLVKRLYLPFVRGEGGILTLDDSDVAKVIAQGRREKIFFEMRKIVEEKCGIYNKITEEMFKKRKKFIYNIRIKREKKEVDEESDNEEKEVKKMRERLIEYENRTKKNLMEN